MTSTVLVVEEDDQASRIAPLQSSIRARAWRCCRPRPGARPSPWPDVDSRTWSSSTSGSPTCQVRTSCRRLPPFSDVPILMLTAKASERERIQGLELGADDYMTKPFSPRVDLACESHLASGPDSVTHGQPSSIR